jgi:hypothetical protein
MDADADKGALLAQLISQLERSELRLQKLENDAAEMEIVLKKSSLNQDAAFDGLGMQFASLTKDLAALDAQLHECTKRSGRLMLRFRDIIKLEQLEDINMRLRDWPVEFFVPREEFISMVQVKIKELP